MAESAQMADWIAKDGDFQLEQERRRAGIRLKEKRAKAVDFLALNLKFASANEDSDEDEDDGLDLDEVGMEIDFDEPYSIFEVSSLPSDTTLTCLLRCDLYCRTCHSSRRKSSTTTSSGTSLSRRKISTSSSGRYVCILNFVASRRLLC